MGIVCSLLMVVFLFIVGVCITGAIIKACIWLCLLPLALTIMGIGFALCCTLILIPVGLKVIGVGFEMLLFT